MRRPLAIPVCSGFKGLWPAKCFHAALRIDMMADVLSPCAWSCLLDGTNYPALDGDNSQPMGTGTQLRILIVDDNVDAASSLGRLLGLLGNEVRVVHDGAAALAEIDRFRPRAVLLDLGMPIMDGFETANQIRARPAGQDIAIVAVTGWGQGRDRERTETAGFFSHLTKPVHLAELEAVLGRLAASNPNAATPPSHVSPT